MMRQIPLLLALLALLVAVGGCEKKREAFAPLPGSGPNYDGAVYVASETGDAPLAVEADPPPATTSDRVLTVDAMVGQINGKPVYASTIFRTIGETSLVNRGKSLPRRQFIGDLQRDINGVIWAQLTNTLVLAEAEAELSPQQQQGLFQVLRKEREKILAEFLGSQARANDALQARGYQGLDDYIEERRQEMLVQSYLSQKLYPKVYVTRKMVERYYRDNIDQFVKPGKVTLRIILVRSDNLANEVAGELAAGNRFRDVAEKYTSYRRSAGGIVEYEARLESFDALPDEIDEAVRSLNEGQATDRIIRYTPGGKQFWWVQLERYQPGEATSLTDAYLDIEGRVRGQQFAKLNREYTTDLIRKGNYTSPDAMTRALVEIAVNRYAQSE